MSCAELLTSYAPDNSSRLIPSEFNCNYTSLRPLTLAYQESHNSSWADIETELLKTCVVEELPPLLNNLRKITFVLSAFLVNAAIGCKISFSKLGEFIKKPYAVAIGWLSQFSIMPTLAFVLINIFRSTTTLYERFVLFLTGCAPGGNMSSLMVLWLGGDVNLSVAMTLINQISCVVMIPLLLRLYSPIMPDSAAVSIKEIPTLSIFLSEIPIIAALLAGYGWKRKYPKAAERHADNLVRVGIAMGAISCVMTLTLDPAKSAMQQIKSSFRISPIVMFLAYIGIVGGYAFAVIMGKLCRRLVDFGYEQHVAIAIETCVQNVPTVLLIMQLNLDCPIVIAEVSGTMFAFISTGLVMVLLPVCIVSRVREKRSEEKEGDECISFEAHVHD